MERSPRRRTVRRNSAALPHPCYIHQPAPRAPQLLPRAAAATDFRRRRGRRGVVGRPRRVAADGRARSQHATRTASAAQRWRGWAQRPRRRRTRWRRPRWKSSAGHRHPGSRPPRAWRPVTSARAQAQAQPTKPARHLMRRLLPIVDIANYAPGARLPRSCAAPGAVAWRGPRQRTIHSVSLYATRALKVSQTAVAEQGRPCQASSLSIPLRLPLCCCLSCASR